MDSAAQRMAGLPPERRAEIINALSPDALAELASEPWWFVGRPEQHQPPGDWAIWLVMAGRGWGKSRTGAEWLVDLALSQQVIDGVPCEYAVIAETFSDCRKVCVEGPSGLLRVLQRRGADYDYRRGAWQIRVGSAIIHMMSADNPDAGRGFNLAGMWCDELAKWRDPHRTWTEGLAPALRIGSHPRVCVTTTPRPSRLLLDWAHRTDGSVVLTSGSTFDNAANLSERALEELRLRYSGTALGRQELEGHLLTSMEGALWTREVFDEFRVDVIPERVVRRVVGVDPAMSVSENSDETGIVVAAVGESGTIYVESDYSGRHTPTRWARIVTELDADSVIVEVNQGGDLVRQVLLTAGCDKRIQPATAVNRKEVRAEPIAMLYEQGKVRHVGTLTALEDQAVSWVPGEEPRRAPGEAARGRRSPDRVDALVWAVSGLLSGAGKVTVPTRDVPRDRVRAAQSHLGGRGRSPLRAR